MKERLLDGSPFFGTFPSDRFPNAKKAINAKIRDKNSTYAAIYINYTSEFREILKLLRTYYLVNGI